MEFIKDQEKRILLSAISREEKVIKEHKELAGLIPVINQLDYYFMYDRLFKKIYQQGKADAIEELETPMIPKEFMREQYLRGAREFAEWLANGCAFIRRLGEDDMHTVDELISEWQKGEENG